jgi:SWI/SNF-related matrix-associated actin-dependent regulator of chromatin subfamily A member 5
MLSEVLERADAVASSIVGDGHEQPRQSLGGDHRSRRIHDEDEESSEDSDTFASAKKAASAVRAVPRLQKQPPNLKNGTLKDYQLAGLNWLIQLYESHLNGILADEMGLGKTVQSIALIAYIKQFRKVSGPHLVVVPKSTVSNWAREFEKWFPSAQVLTLLGNKDERKEIKQKFLTNKYNVLLTTFDMAMIESGLLKKYDWHLLIVDEAHRLKNENSKLFKELNQLKTRARLLLTGTPLQNNLHELWALLYFLLPDIFNSAAEFDSFFEVKNEEQEAEFLHKLHRVYCLSIFILMCKILKPFLLRRLKSDVAKTLPPKKEYLLYVGMTKMQKSVYRSILMKDIDAIQGQTGERTRLLNIMMQLRKAANHPYLFEGVEDRSLPVYGEHLVVNSGKMILLDGLIKRLLSQDSRILIFSQMARVLDILEDYCIFREFPHCRIDGSTSSEDRESQIEEFNRERSPKKIFLLTTRAGGLGINLYTADIVVIFDSDWNPQADLQAQDRAHRIGQTKPVHVYRFVTQNSIEERVVERAELKLRLDAIVIQQGRLTESSNKLSKDAMLSMIRTGADEVFRTEGDDISAGDIDRILSLGEESAQKLKQKTETQASKLSLLSGLDQTEDQALDADKIIDQSLAEDGSGTFSLNPEEGGFMSHILSALSNREKRQRQRM